MLGLDCPSRFDMTLVAEQRRLSTVGALKAVIQRMVNEGRISEESTQRIRESVVPRFFNLMKGGP
jgi:hypothetical protein